MILPTLERALTAYGGAARWQAAQRFSAQVSAHGLAFTMKRRPAFIHARVEGAVHEPQCKLTLIGRDAGVTGVLDGGETRLEDASGAVLDRRPDARAGFPYGRRLWRWDDLDMAYFANYAFWSYFTFPALLLRDDISWSAPRDGWLRARFPAHLPAHSPVQDFAINPQSGLVSRHHYTAEVIGGWAKAVQILSEYRLFGGIPVPTRRRVTPRGPLGTALPGPVLIAINVHDFALHD